MAACEEVTPMDVMESSKKRRATEFVESWFAERCLAKDEQETSIDFGKRLSSEFMMPQKEKKVYKAKLVAVEALDDERKRFAAAAAAVGIEIHPFLTEKMYKTVVEMDKAEKMDKIELGQETAVDNMQTEKMDKRAESDLPARTETSIDIYPEDLSFITERAKRLNRSDDWIEKQKRRYRQRAALCVVINDPLEQLQEEWMEQGYVQPEEEYEANLAETQEYTRQLWRSNKYSDFSRFA